MNHPAPTTRSDWSSMTERIFQSVGQKIQETRKIQFQLRFVLASTLVSLTFIVYWFALMTA